MHVFAYRAVGKEQKEASFVKVKLPDGQNRVQTFTGLVDTGNGLREPISGQPVCLMEKRILKSFIRKVCRDSG